MRNLRFLHPAVIVLCFFTVFLLGAFPARLLCASEPSHQEASSDAKAPTQEEASGEVKSVALEKVSEKIEEEKALGAPANQARQMARELREIDAEQKALAEASASMPEGTLEGVCDSKLTLQSKMALADRKRDLVEKRAAFLAEKVRIQSVIHQKIRFFLTNVFSESASFFVITDQIKMLRGSIDLRLRERRLFERELEAVSARVQIEEKYLSTKSLLLAVSKNEEKACLQEALSLAEERLKVFKDLRAFYEEQIEFSATRIQGAREFDNLIRLRRKEILTKKLFSKAQVACGPREIALALSWGLFLAAFFVFRRRFYTWIRRLPSFLNREGDLATTRALWFFGCASLLVYGGLSALGYRWGALALGVASLCLFWALLGFVCVKGLVEWIFMSILQRISRTTQAEIKQSSPVYFIVQTALMWLIFGGIFYQILNYWAFRHEAGEFLFRVAHHPLFRSEKITLSLWILGRSLIAFWAFYAFARFLNGILTARVFPKTALNKNSQNAIRSVIQFFFMVTGALAGLQMLGIDLNALAVFSGTLGIGIGFGLQEIVKNIFSGFVIFFERPIRVGDVVEIEGTPGTVKSIRTRSTIVNSFDNISMVVPNSDFLNRRVVNWSHSDRTVRVESRIGVAYGSDVALVKQILLGIAKANSRILARPEPFVIFEEFAESALLFKVFYWTDVADRLEVKSEINFSIYEQFKEKGITIPFPQRDLHLKSSDFELKGKGS
ncbi:MAG: mechanosensitive ion channel domain-containing protein [Candidatus Omnitrophota bacterium]